MTVTHQRGPTTAPRGQFELLCLQPDPVPGSSDHLGISVLLHDDHVDAELSADAGST